MKKPFVSLGVVFISSVSIGQAKIFVPEMNYQFDTLYQGEPCDHDFMVINQGDQPLLFSNVKTGCGCDVPSWEKVPVLSGDTTYVNYRYDSNRVGPFSKYMTIQSNDPQNPTLVIRVKGIILPKEE